MSSIRRLSGFFGLDWVLVIVVNRGYHWKEVSVLTVVAKVCPPVAGAAAASTGELVTTATRDIAESLRVHGLSFKITDASRMWRAFGGCAAAAGARPCKPPSFG